MRRAVVISIAKLDEAIDEVLYRPAIVRAFKWVPRWWLCDLAKLSMSLDERWGTRYWETSIVPGGPCEACGRRAAIHIYGGVDEEDDRDRQPQSYLERRPVYVCGWCHLHWQIDSEEDLQNELAAARQDSVSWRWRWHVRT